jgi:Nif-specific regulatory protein
LELPERLSDVLELIRESVQARHVALAVPNQKGGFTLLEARDRNGLVEQSMICWPLIQRTGERGSPMILTDISSDPFWAEEEHVVLNRIGSILAVPLRVESELEGVLYVDRTKMEAPFSVLDRLFVQAVIRSAGPGIRNHRILARQRRHLDRLQQEVALPYRFESILGECSAMTEVFMGLARVIETEVTALIVGASGTGKELVARAIHYKGPRGEQPFRAINCTELADSLLESELFGHTRGAFTGAEAARIGLLEAADGGTVFLDEVGDLTPRAQIKLLRVSQEKEVRPVGDNVLRPINVRFISATHRDLAAEVEKGTFREDLFYRLNVVTIHLPPLRERDADIPLLLRHFLALYAKDMKKRTEGFSREALEILCQYHWPGNVRELQNMIQTLLVHCGEERVIAADHLPEHVRPSVDLTPKKGLKHRLAIHEEEILRQSLRRSEGNKSQAARALGISRQTLLKKLKKYDLIPEYRKT